MTTDDELVARARAGDDGAFDAIVERYADHVYGVCLRYFRDPHDADDAFQMAFLACYRGLRGFRGRAQLSTWLYRVATNACHDLARRRARRPRTVPLDDERRAVGAVDQSAVDRLAAARLQPGPVDAPEQPDHDPRQAGVLRDGLGAG